ncbi:MAG: PKD domain-containing protein [Flavobacteriales bacterium]
MRPFYVPLAIFFLFFLMPFTTSGQGATGPIKAGKYLPTMLFDGNCAGNCPEPNFPLRIDLNRTQDANGDSLVNAEDAMENLIRFAIGDSLVDTGRTGLPNRGPNDQRPAVYFHHLDLDSFQVYQYWHYYADNDWVNNHEHDVQYYFVYEQCGVPLYILFSYHDFTNMFDWGAVAKDDGHPMFDVEAGSHGYQNATDHDGVKIRYNGDIFERNGRLTTADSVRIPWLIFSNDSMVPDATPYPPVPDTMYKGDSSYPFPNPCEYCDGRASPWLRSTWDSVQLPNTGNCPDPKADFEAFGSGYSYVFLDSSTRAAEAYWRFGDGTKDTGFYPMHRYDSAGTYEVCLSVVDSCRENADCRCKTLTVEDSSTAIRSVGKEAGGIELMPNPARDRLLIRSDGEHPPIRKVRLRSIQGRLLMASEPEQTGRGRYQVSIRKVPRGVFFVELLGEGWSSVKKVLKVRP